MIRCSNPVLKRITICFNDWNSNHSYHAATCVYIVHYNDQSKILAFGAYNIPTFPISIPEHTCKTSIFILLHYKKTETSILVTSNPYYTTKNQNKRFHHRTVLTFTYELLLNPHCIFGILSPVTFLFNNTYKQKYNNASL